MAATGCRAGGILAKGCCVSEKIPCSTLFAKGFSPSTKHNKKIAFGENCIYTGLKQE
jgi:hypothetical protein